MKVVIQRVLNAQVEVNNETVGSIGHGLLVFLGIGHDDTEVIADKMIEKIAKLRIFSDSDDKINLSILDINGEILIVSQFTLYADCKKGNRPGFDLAAKPEKAEKLYEYFLDKSAIIFKKVEKGCFGASMKVSLVNDGPFTVVYEV